MTNREIDALVAENVMGWKWIPRNDGYGFLLPPDWRQMLTKDGLSGWIHTPSCQTTNLIGGFFGKGELTDKAPYGGPRFSTDPAASKQLRDRMRELGYVVEIFNRVNGSTWCWIHPGEDGLNESNPREIPAISSDTEEMAVALAALFALGVEVPA